MSIGRESPTEQRAEGRAIRVFALVLGAVYLLAGVLGFVMQFLNGYPLEMTGAPDGSLLGSFTVNPFLNTVHVFTGIAGLALSRSYGESKAYALVIGTFYIVLFLLAAFSGNSDVLRGLLPFSSAHVGLYFLTGFFALQLYAHW